MNQDGNERFVIYWITLCYVMVWYSIVYLTTLHVIVIKHVYVAVRICYVVFESILLCICSIILYYYVMLISKIIVY